ncbi:MAG: hypothetical protein JNK87_11545 [Bryobacterales bacterium]|nr:hypothetical protein [Bryobacterales bacterium]
MTLAFLGHDMNPPPVHRVARVTGCLGETEGGFLHNGSYWQESDTLRVTFRPEFLVLQGLDAVQEARVLRHEEQHRVDFVELAERLERGLRTALRQRRDPEIDHRWEWFLYDIANRANQFHRSSGQGETINVAEPHFPRPV